MEILVITNRKVKPIRNDRVGSTFKVEDLLVRPSEAFGKTVLVISQKSYYLSPRDQDAKTVPESVGWTVHLRCREVKQ